jgi:hypothetical protein
LNFALPAELSQQPLLYSGIIRLIPIIPANNSNNSNSSSSNSTAASPNPYDSLVPLVIPYQGYSQDYRQLPVMARVIGNTDDATREFYSSQLAADSKALCYAPRSEPSAAGNLMDYGNDVQYVCDSGFGERPATQIDVSLGVLQESPECSLRVTLAPQVPMQW